MDQSNSVAIPAGAIPLGGKSWTAYVMPLLLGVILGMGILTALAAAAMPLLAIPVFLLALAWTIYQFLLQKSYRLYYDDVGVWLSAGVLPWQKGIYGVKWRDVDEAGYFQGIGSWLLKSYTIRIGHRFTKSSELIITHWRRGDQVVTTINEQHGKLVRTQALH